ncbi:PEGA domain-containing protein [Myxococcota bacterium]|nr:PEGA domain-containing protein [Myxococcota bacterium]
MMLAPIVLLSALVFAAEPPTPEAVDEAKKYFEAGRQAYEAGDYLAAALAFEGAQRLAPRPQIVFSMAQAYRQQWSVDRDPSKLRRALELYDQYLVEVPVAGRRLDAQRHAGELRLQLAELEARGLARPSTKAEVKTQLMVSSRTPGALASLAGSEPQEVPLIADVEAGRHEVVVEAPGYEPQTVQGVAVEGRLVVVEVNLVERPGKLRISAPDGADVTVDGRPAGTTPLLFPLDVTPGEHVVAVLARGHHPHVERVVVERGEEALVVAALETTAQREVSYWVLGAGGVFFASTAIAALTALASEGEARIIQNKLDAEENLTVEERDRYNQLRVRRDDMLTVTSLFLVATVTFAGAGGLLYALDTPSVQATRGPTVAGGDLSDGTGLSMPVLSPVVLDDGAGLVLSGRF